MEDRRRGIHFERVASSDARIVPALVLVIFDDRHVIGEDPAETGSFVGSNASLLSSST
jgi:hypothetical protein